jgi:hypothetical protein
MDTPSGSDPVVGSLRSLRLVAVAILVVLLVQLAVMSFPPLAAALAARKHANAHSETPSAAISRDTDKSRGAEIAHGNAGSIRTVLGMGIVLNKESSLEREWTTLNVAGMPARLIGPASVITAYKPRSYSGEYQYSVAFDVEALEPLSALEVRFLTFDVWGDKGRSLSMTMVEDFPVGRRISTGLGGSSPRTRRKSITRQSRISLESERRAVVSPWRIQMLSSGK